jgi:hypothetical protein
MKNIYDVAITNDDSMTVYRAVVATNHESALVKAEREYERVDKPSLGYREVKKITVERLYKAGEIINDE